jgi:hypothetical protein
LTSTYQNCYTADRGAVFNIPNGLGFTDTSSTFKQNAGLDSQFYCDGCIATFTSSIFVDSLARDGSIMIINNAATVTFNGISMNHGKARRYGGAIMSIGSGV